MKTIVIAVAVLAITVITVNAQTGPYAGSSGTLYRYDLGNPSDRMNYSMDLDAQMNDSLNLNPGVQLDRMQGQFGGGIQDW